MSGNWLRLSKRLGLYLRDGMACVYCQRPSHHALGQDGFSVDHVIPRNGGNNQAANLVTCCTKCNSSKKDRDLEEWLQSPRCPAVGTPAEVLMRVLQATTTPLKPHRRAARLILVAHGYDPKYI